VDRAGLRGQNLSMARPSRDRDSEPFDWTEDLHAERSWLRRLVRRKRLARGKHEDSEDLAQEALGRALKGRARLRFSDRGALRGWLATVVGNLARDRGRKRQPDALASGDRAGLLASRPTPSQAIERSEEGAELRARVRQLPERSRAVVELRIWQEASFAEIGAEVGCSEGNARVIFHRALGELRDAQAGPNA